MFSQHIDDELTNAFLLVYLSTASAFPVLFLFICYRRWRSMKSRRCPRSSMSRGRLSSPESFCCKTVNIGPMAHSDKKQRNIDQPATQRQNFNIIILSHRSERAIVTHPGIRRCKWYVLKCDWNRVRTIWKPCHMTLLGDFIGRLGAVFQVLTATPSKCKKQAWTVTYTLFRVLLDRYARFQEFSPE